MTNLATLRKAATEPCDGCCYGDDMAQAADEIERLRQLLLTGLAIHGGEAHTYSEKEWRAEARAALGIKS